MFLNKLITLIMLHYRDPRLTWITSMPNQIQEDKSWNKNKRPLKEPTIQTQLKLLIQPKIHLKLRLTSTSTASTMLVWTLTNMLLKLHQLLLAITLRNNLPTSQLELLINKRSQLCLPQLLVVTMPSNNMITKTREKLLISISWVFQEHVMK